MGGPCSGQTRWVIGSGGEVVDEFWFGGVVFFFSRLLFLRLFVFDIHFVYVFFFALSRFLLFFLPGFRLYLENVERISIEIDAIGSQLLLPIKSGARSRYSSCHSTALFLFKFDDVFKICLSNVGVLPISYDSHWICMDLIFSNRWQCRFLS